MSKKPFRKTAALAGKARTRRASGHAWQQRVRDECDRMRRTGAGMIFEIPPLTKGLNGRRFFAGSAGPDFVGAVTLVRTIGDATLNGVPLPPPERVQRQVVSLPVCFDAKSLRDRASFGWPPDVADWPTFQRQLEWMRDFAAHGAAFFLLGNEDTGEAMAVADVWHLLSSTSASIGLGGPRTKRSDGVFSASMPLGSELMQAIARRQPTVPLLALAAQVHDWQQRIHGR